MPVPTIATPRLLLREWREDDVDDLARIYADVEVVRYVGGRRSTKDETAAAVHAFDLHWQEHGFGLWATEERATGTFLGRIGLMHHPDWSETEHKVEVGWLLDRGYWGRGLATEGGRAAVDFGFDVVGLESVISIIQVGNVASRRVAEKLGMALQGETSWKGNDVVWYARAATSRRRGRGGRGARVRRRGGGPTASTRLLG